MESTKKSHVSPENAKLMRIATWASINVALFLIVLKFYAWIVTDSVSLLSALVDSMLDVVASLVNFFAVRYALMPPDEDHRFGHTAAEDVAALAQSAFIAGSAMFITISAVGKLITPEPVDHTTVGIIVMVISMIATFGLVAFQRYVVNKTGSTAIDADSLHYTGDLLMNGAVIIALILSAQFGLWIADPVFAIIIACYIIFGAWKIGNNAFDKLMDKEFEEDDRQEIVDFILKHEGVLGLHDLKTRYSGVKPFIQFHLELDGSQTLNEAHEIADNIERKLEEKYPGSEVFVHQDPVKK